MRTALALALCALVATAKPSPAQVQRKKLAKVWLDYTKWLHHRSLKTEATRALAAATAADANAKGLPELTAAVAALAQDAETPATLAKRRAKAHRDAARILDKLAGLDGPPEEQAQRDAYRMEALALDPAKPRIAKVVGQIRKTAGNRKKTNEAGRLLVLLRGAVPDRDWKLETELAKSDVCVIRAKDHALVGYVSLPRNWKPARKKPWPVLVTVDGAGSNFLGSARAFAKHRGDRPYIVLAPCTLSNTNKLNPKKYPYYTKEKLEEGNRDRIEFDLAGLAGLLAVVQEQFGGAKQIGITGFSGGGNVCYGYTVRNPDKVRFAAPACANFSGMGLRDVEPIEGGGPAIHVMTGANDPHRQFTHGNKNIPGIEPQTDNAMALLERLAFKKARRTMLPGVRHSALQKQVWEFADEQDR